jgi:hypothetical protein
VERDCHHGYRIGRRTIICMLLILVLAIFSNFASVPYQP